MNYVQICFPTLWLVCKKWLNTSWENIRKDVNIVLTKLSTMWICGNTFHDHIAQFTKKFGTCKSFTHVNCVNILERLMELCDFIWEEGISIKSMNNEDKIHKIVNCLKSRAYVRSEFWSKRSGNTPKSQENEIKKLWILKKKRKTFEFWKKS